MAFRWPPMSLVNKDARSTERTRSAASAASRGYAWLNDLRSHFTAPCVSRVLKRLELNRIAALERAEPIRATGCCGTGTTIEAPQSPLTGPVRLPSGYRSIA
jgi:hypothetical protein